MLPGRTRSPGTNDAAQDNAAAFTSDGFYRTRDLASVQVIGGERDISIDGRIKDLINRGGEKVNAGEVELLLLNHPGIGRAAVVAMPDPRLGERACAFLVATGRELTLTEIQAHLHGLGVAKFRWPERLGWVTDLTAPTSTRLTKGAAGAGCRTRRPRPAPGDQAGGRPRRLAEIRRRL